MWKKTEWRCMLGREATVVSIRGTLLIWARSLWMIKSAEALCTSFGGHDNSKIADCIQDHGINLVRSSASSGHKTQYDSHFPIWNPVIFTLHPYRSAPHGNWQTIAMFVIIRVYIIGGDGTQRGANAIHEVSTKFPLCGARFAFTSNSPASASIMFVQGVLCIPASWTSSWQSVYRCFCNTVLASCRCYHQATYDQNHILYCCIVAVLWLRDSSTWRIWIGRLQNSLQMLVEFFCIFKLQECKRWGLKVVVVGILKTIHLLFDLRFNASSILFLSGSGSSIVRFSGCYIKFCISKSFEYHVPKLWDVGIKIWQILKYSADELTFHLNRSCKIYSLVD